MSEASPSTRRNGARGSLRGRLVRALALAFGLWGAGAVVGGAWLLRRTLTEQLDASLRAHAHSEVLTAIDREDRAPHLHDAPVPVAAGASLEKFAALYDAAGAPLAHTANLRGHVPPFAALPAGEPFALTVRGRALRAVRVPTGDDTAARWLLLAVPSDALDAATTRVLEGGALALLLTLGLAWVLAWALSRGLVGGLEAVAATARRVADGALSERVGAVPGPDELRVLARDLDAMVERLDGLVRAQERFAGDAAHELRTPLTALRGELELALRRPRDAEGYRVAIERALGDVDALQRCVDELLALARAQRGALPAGVTALGPPLEGALRSVRARADAREVRVSLPDERFSLPRVAVPGDALERALRNLLDNAVRHARSAVRVHVERREGDVVCHVLDDGEGLAQDDAERVFEPFVRLDEARSRDAGGSGLGLALVRATARAYGGDVSVRFDEGSARSARFELRLPEAPAARE